jgi:hypothetical protein
MGGHTAARNFGLLSRTKFTLATDKYRAARSVGVDVIVMQASQPFFT